MAQGVIIKGIAGVYSVLSDDNEVYEVTARGRFRIEGITPLVGDRVVLDEECKAIIRILPRICEFVRPPVANIDRLVVVASLKEPDFDLRLTDTMLVFAEEKGISAAVCINKCDLDESEKANEIAGIYSKAGYSTVITSAIFGIGAEQLQSIFKGHISAVAGNSGVGKSSLINLIDEKLSLQTGAVSRIKRGRHTTRSVELLPLSCGGFVADTPGFSRIDLPKISLSRLPTLFPEIKRHHGECRFSDCSHLHEHGCAVTDALNCGEISQSRYENYKHFYNILKETKDWKQKS